MSKMIALEYLRKTNGKATFEEISKATGISMADYQAAFTTYQEEISDELPEDLLDMVAGGTGFGGLRTDDSGYGDAEG